jgi:hypothetical protein
VRRLYRDPAGEAVFISHGRSKIRLAVYRCFCSRSLLDYVAKASAFLNGEKSLTNFL